jgi:hypothetical protein
LKKLNLFGASKTDPIGLKGKPTFSS